MKALLLPIFILLSSCSLINESKDKSVKYEQDDFAHVSDYDYGGVLVDRDTLITVNHTNLSVGTKITWNDGAIERTVVERVRWKDADLLLAHLNEPLPESVKVYPIRELKQGETVLIKRYRDRDPITKVAKNGGAWIRLTKGPDLTYGDSGNPWFYKKKEKIYLVGLTSKGLWGEGPNLGSVKIQQWINENK